MNVLIRKTSPTIITRFRPMSSQKDSLLFSFIFMSGQKVAKWILPLMAFLYKPFAL